jgi:hypothetical protein
MKEGRLVEELCPHPYFGKGEHPWTGNEINCCIFHAPMEEKKDHLGLFWFKFWRLFARAKRAAENAETEEDKKNIWLQCFGFVFPYTEFRFYNREFPFSVDMRRAKFSDDAVFWLATFSGAARFRNVAFSGAAVFRDATFLGPADFTGAIFEEFIIFQSVSVKDSVIFDRTRFSSRRAQTSAGSVPKNPILKTSKPYAKPSYSNMLSFTHPKA